MTRTAARMLGFFLALLLQQQSVAAEGPAATCGAAKDCVFNVNEEGLLTQVEHSVGACAAGCVGSLDLSENGIKDIALGAFTDLPNVTSIKLEGNPGIATINIGTFKDLYMLKTVSMNGVPKIAVRAFENLPQLESIQIQENSKGLRMTGNMFVGPAAGEGTYVFRVQIDTAPKGEWRVSCSSSNRCELSGVVATCDAGCEFRMSGTGSLTQENPELRRAEGGCAENCNFLEFYSMGITDLAPGVFTNLPKVKSIHLIGNLLTSIKTGTFTGANLPALTEISLESNSIRNIEVGAISGLPMLEEINLYNNKVTNLRVGALTNLPILARIILGINAFTRLKAGTFTGFPKLKTIDLAWNKISNIDVGAIANAPELDTVRLNGQSPSLAVTATMAAQMYVGNATFFLVEAGIVKTGGDIKMHVSCSSITGCKVLGDFVEMCGGSAAGNMQEGRGNQGPIRRAEAVIDNDHGCAFFKDSTGTALTLAEENEGDCAQYCTATYAEVDSMMKKARMRGPTCGEGAFVAKESITAYLGCAVSPPAEIVACGEDCFFHVSVAGLLTQVEDSAGACAANCEGNIALSEKGIKAIATGAFTNLTKVVSIFLNNNKLTSIKNGTFTGADLPAVTEIWLQENIVNDIEVGAISGLAMLEKINLDNNKVTNLRVGALTRFPKVMYIGFSQNLLTSIKAGTFTGTNFPAVTRISLSNNAISDIEREAFTGLLMLIQIDLDFNNIVSITAGAFANMPELDIVSLNDQSPNLEVTATLVAQMFAVPAAFFVLGTGSHGTMMNDGTFVEGIFSRKQVSCSSNSSCKVLGDFVEGCGGYFGNMEYGGYGYDGNNEDGSYNDRGCAYFRDSTGTKLTLVEENAGDCAQDCTPTYAEVNNTMKNARMHGPTCGESAFDIKESLKVYLACATGPPAFAPCGDDCFFHVSAAGLLTQVEDRAGACAANCKGTLDLNNKGITDIAPDDLTSLPNVIGIDLSHNLLTSIKTGTFTGANLPSVTYINFEHNTIVSIEAGAIANTPELDYVDLALQSPSLAVTATLAAQMYVGTAAFFKVYIDDDDVQVSCSSNNRCEVLGDFVEACGNFSGNMQEGGGNQGPARRAEVVIDDDHGCAFFKDPAGTALTLAEENEGDCAQYCTIYAEVDTVMKNARMRGPTCGEGVLNAAVSLKAYLACAIAPPVTFKGCGDDCFFHVSAAGLLTQVEDRAGACAANCEGDLDNLESGKTILDLGTMGIKEIDAGAFTNLPNVTNIMLRYNHLTSIKVGTFVGTNLPAVAYIDLHGNRLTSIKAGTFTNFPRLASIMLRANKIVSIETGAIANTPELDYVDLALQSPSLAVTATLAAQMYVGTAAFFKVYIDDDDVQVSCSSNNRCEVLGDFVEACGNFAGNMQEGGGNQGPARRAEAVIDDDHGCAFFKDSTGTTLTLAEENEGDCAQYCTPTYDEVDTVMKNARMRGPTCGAGVFNAAVSLKAYLACAIAPPVTFKGCGDDCFFHVSAAGVLTQVEDKAGACTANCEGDLDNLGSGKTILDLGNMGIKDITSGAFTNLPNVTNIRLQYNYVTSIKTGTFTGANLPAVRSIAFDNNRLSEIKTGAFNGLPKLNQISFSQNFHKCSIEAGAIANAPELDGVRLD